MKEIYDSLVAKIQKRLETEDVPSVKTQKMIAIALDILDRLWKEPGTGNVPTVKGACISNAATERVNAVLLTNDKFGVKI